MATKGSRSDSKKQQAANLEIAQRLYDVICRNGGKMDLGSAISKMKKPDRDFVKRTGASKFVGSHKKLFQVAKDDSQMSVEVILPLKFCTHQAKEKQGCPMRNQCGMLHLCPFFIKGNCSYKEKCRSSHEIKDEHTMTILKKLHLADLDSETLRNLMQKAVADTEGQRAADNNPIPDICKFYNSIKTCTNGDKCTFLHVCQHFVDRTCKFGVKCKRAHNFSDPHNASVLKNHNLHILSPPMILHVLSGRERKRSLSSSSDGSAKDFQAVRKSSASPGPSAAAIGSPLRSIPPASTKINDDAHICGFHLRGFCSYGLRCIYSHTELPYLWQRRSSQGPWESFNGDLNTMVEQAFCDVRIDDFSLAIYGQLYSIKFDDMVAVALNPKQNMPAKFMIQRLSTQSSVEAALGNVFSTRWSWYWLDDIKTWQSYDSPKSGVVPNTTCSQSLEKGFLAGEMSHLFSAGPFQYNLNYKNMEQENNTIKTKRAVRRRPEFVGKNDMKEVAKRRAVARVSAAASSGGEVGKQPAHWEDIPADKEYICHNLPTISEEYKQVDKQFQSTLASAKRIVKIERIQNLDLWTQFAQKKARMESKTKNAPEERKLFHGTSSDIVKAICQQGFDWRMCGKHGTVYGKGSYFASTSSYSHRYTDTYMAHGRENYMFLARVIVGSYTAGNSSLTRPPPKDASNPYGELYDSCVNDTGNPGLFVVFDNSQTYPEYLITYL